MPRRWAGQPHPWPAWRLSGGTGRGIGIWSLHLTCSLRTAWDRRLCTNLSVELFVGADTHPADDARTSAIGLMLERIGCAAEAQAIGARWAELVSLSGQQMPQEHALAYPDKLLGSLADFVRDAARQLGLVSWVASQSAAPSHVGALLNEAWGEFHLHPDTFAEYESRQYEALRIDLGITA